MPLAPQPASRREQIKRTLIRAGVGGTLGYGVAVAAFILGSHEFWHPTWRFGHVDATLEALLRWGPIGCAAGCIAGALLPLARRRRTP